MSEGMPETRAEDRLFYVWIDVEATGLTEHDSLIEFGVIGTTEDLRVLFEFETLAAPTPEAMGLLAANPVVSEMHRVNGLTPAIEEGLAAGTLPTIAEAEQLILDQIKKHPRRVGGKLLLAGSGVWHSDRNALARHTPRLAKLFADRDIVDGGIFRQFYRRIVGHNLVPANDQKDHRALGDIRLHLEEMQAFANVFLEHAARNRT